MGFPHELWPRSIEYFCKARAFTTFAPIHPNKTDDAKKLKHGWTCYKAANNGEPFEGLKLPLGVLIYYKSAMHKRKPGVEPKTMPGIFAGWRMDFGFKHRKVHLIFRLWKSQNENKMFWQTVANPCMWDRSKCNRSPPSPFVMQRSVCL